MPEQHCTCGSPLLVADEITSQLGEQLARQLGTNPLGLAHSAGLTIFVSEALRPQTLLFHGAPRMDVAHGHAAVAVATVSAFAHPHAQAWMIACAVGLQLAGVDETIAYVGGAGVSQDLEEDLYRAEEFASGFTGWSPEWVPAERRSLSRWAAGLEDVDLDPSRGNGRSA